MKKTKKILCGFGVTAVLLVVSLVLSRNRNLDVSTQAINVSLSETKEIHSTTASTGTVLMEETPIPEPTPRIIVHITAAPTKVPTPIPPTPTPNPWRDTEYPPTCEEAGYILHENTSEGITTTLEGAPPLGHDWSEWTKDTEAGMMVRICYRCGKQMSRSEVYTGTIPRIDFYGSMEGISKSDRVTLGFDFTSPTEVFSCYSYTTWQGHNTLNFPKKNYTIRLYDDVEITKKHKLTFYDWQREHKYILKANYRDFSQARNLIAANLWADMAKTRTDLFETLRHTSNYGAVAGFPVIVYHNGEFHGLYTMNLHIDDDLYQMDNAYDAVMISNSTEPEETRFYANAAFEDEKTAWEVEFCGTEDNNQWAKDQLNELITFVMSSDDTTFHESLGDYLDINGAIDYLIFLYVTGLQDNAAKDLVLLKYHNCDVWIPSVYDMEHAFGLASGGTEYLSSDVFLPVKKDGVWDSETNSLLWDRLLQIFELEIQARYTELRQRVLTEEGLTARVNMQMAMIPEDYYKRDIKLWPRQLPDGSQQDQMVAYICDRLSILDTVLVNE